MRYNPMLRSGEGQLIPYYWPLDPNTPSLSDNRWMLSPLCAYEKIGNGGLGKLEHRRLLYRHDGIPYLR